MTDALVVFARFTAKAGQEEALKRELLKRIAPTRAEPDNIFYDLHQGVDQPVFLRHMATPHFRAMDEAVRDLQADPYSCAAATSVCPATPFSGAQAVFESSGPHPRPAATRGTSKW